MRWSRSKGCLCPEGGGRGVGVRRTGVSAGPARLGPAALADLGISTDFKP